MKAKLGYGLIALAIIAIGVGVPIATTMGVGAKTKIVTKTKWVTKRATFNGTQAGLVRYLHPRGSGETRCPSNYRPGVRCYVMAGNGWLIQAAFVPQSGLAG